MGSTPIVTNASFRPVMAYARLHDTALIVGRDEDERAVEAMRELLDVGFENISLMQAGLPG